MTPNPARVTQRLHPASVVRSSVVKRRAPRTTSSSRATCMLRAPQIEQGTA